MSPERRQKIEQLYQAVMEQEPGRRAAFLKESVPDDELRRELESLMLDPNPEAMVQERPGSEGPLKPGVLVGPYRIVERLGSGGLGDVYRATDTRLRRSVAIKIIRDQNENWRQRFIHEARAASALNHPNIVTAYDVSNAEGLDFLVMECVKGQTLNRALNEKPISASVSRSGMHRRLRTHSPQLIQPDHSSRSEAEQHHDHERGPRENSRFRFGQVHDSLRSGRTRNNENAHGANSRGTDSRHSRLYVTRTGYGQARGSSF